MTNRRRRKLIYITAKNISRYTMPGIKKTDKITAPFKGVIQEKSVNDFWKEGYVITGVNK